MMRVRVVNRSRSVVLAEDARVADRWWLRFRGLLARPPLAAGEGLLLTPCQAVHTCGMRYPLDIVVLDAGGRVVACYAALRPWRRTRWHRTAAQVLELPAGTLEATRTCTGDELEWQSADAAASIDPRASERR